MSLTSTDPIADMLSRIRNACRVNKAEVVLPHSKVKQAVADLLKENKYLLDYHVSDLSVGKSITLVLNSENTNSPITEIKRLSTPGRRVYAAASKIPSVKQGRGIIILSTSKGLMTGKEARRQHIGGELICEVY